MDMGRTRAGVCFELFFQAEDGIRDLVRSRGLGDVYKRQIFDRFLGRQHQDGYVADGAQAAANFQTIDAG